MRTRRLRPGTAGASDCSAGRDRLLPAGGARAGPGRLAVLPGAEGRSARRPGPPPARPGPPPISPDRPRRTRRAAPARGRRASAPDRPAGGREGRLGPGRRPARPHPRRRAAQSRGVARPRLHRAGPGEAGRLAGRAGRGDGEGRHRRPDRSAAPTRSPTSRSSSLFATVLYEEARTNAEQGRLDRAVAVLKEVLRGGIRPLRPRRARPGHGVAPLVAGLPRVLKEHRRGEPRHGPRPGQESSRPAPRLRVRLQRQGPRRQAALARPVQGEGRAGRHLGHLVRAVPQGHPRADPALPQAPPARSRGRRPGLRAERPGPGDGAQYVKQFVQQMEHPLSHRDGRARRSWRRSPTSTASRPRS